MTRMFVVGEHHSIETDGFSYLRSNLEDLSFTGDAQEMYEQAIGDQDKAFLRCCRGQGEYVPWGQTLQLVCTMERFQALADPTCPTLKATP